MGEKSVSRRCTSEEQFVPEQGEVNRGLVIPAKCVHLLQPELSRLLEPGMGARSPEPLFSALTTRNTSSPQKPHHETTHRRTALLVGRESKGSALPNP